MLEAKTTAHTDNRRCCCSQESRQRRLESTYYLTKCRLCTHRACLVRPAAQQTWLLLYHRRSTRRRRRKSQLLPIWNWKRYRTFAWSSPNYIRCKRRTTWRTHRSTSLLRGPRTRPCCLSSTCPSRRVTPYTTACYSLHSTAWWRSCCSPGTSSGRLCWGHRPIEMTRESITKTRALRPALVPLWTRSAWPQAPLSLLQLASFTTIRSG